MEVQPGDSPTGAAEPERAAKSMHQASGLVLAPMSMPTLPAVPMMPTVPMVPMAVAVLEQPVQPICLRHCPPASAIRGS